MGPFRDINVQYLYDTMTVATVHIPASKTALSVVYSGTSTQSSLLTLNVPECTWTQNHCPVKELLNIFLNFQERIAWIGQLVQYLENILESFQMVLNFVPKCLQIATIRTSCSTRSQIAATPPKF